MSDATEINVKTFMPYDGGNGVSLAATGASSRASIPGLSGGQGGPDSRIAVSNSGRVSAYIRIGGSDVAATAASYEILPGTKEILKPPYVGANAVWVAAITAGDTTTVNICAGEGT